MRGFPTLLAAILSMTSGPLWGLELPPGPLANLQSEEFRIREKAQAELLIWARERPEAAMDEFHRQSRTAGDPEVRERCLAILRELVNDEYLKEGEGYIGIRMQDETANIPGDPKPRSVIRVVQVVPDSAAHQAGLQVNDLIAGLDDKVWRDGGASLPFSENIRQLKPGSRIALRILRNGNMMDVAVKLARRPLVVDNPFLGQQPVDIEAAERTAKDAYFRRWLERRKPRN
jgi:predicted metalloprotease with PDZ domain